MAEREVPQSSEGGSTAPTPKQIQREVEKASQYERVSKGEDLKANAPLSSPDALAVYADSDYDFAKVDPLVASKIRLENLRISVERDKLKDFGQNRSLRRGVAYCSLVFVGFQLGFSDLLFWEYVNRANQKIGDQVVIAWLSVSVVEIIGILWVVARNLFPFQDVNRLVDLEKESPRSLVRRVKSEEIEDEAS